MYDTRLNLSQRRPANLLLQEGGGGVGDGLDKERTSGGSLQTPRQPQNSAMNPKWSPQDSF